jgi:hypothetical protein
MKTRLRVNRSLPLPKQGCQSEVFPGKQLGSYSSSVKAATGRPQMNDAQMTLSSRGISAKGTAILAAAQYTGLRLVVRPPRIELGVRAPEGRNADS